MRLAELIEAVPGTHSNVRIERVAADSRSAGRDTLFVARKGTNVDGHAFIAEAARGGCPAVVGSDELAPDLMSQLCRRRVCYLRVADSAATLGRVASLLNGRPSSALTVVGVTGTNGKTTVVTLLYELFSALGDSCGLIATTGIRVDGEQLPNAHTTPDALELQPLMARMVRAGCRYCFMEVTSHAIDQRRIAGVDFDGGIFTSLGHDHLDYHGTIDAYAAVKQRFFGELTPSAFALANADDSFGAFMVATTPARVAFYGAGPEALLPWSVERSSEHGMQVQLGPHQARTRLVGEHNASNLAAAVSTALLLGADLTRLVEAIPRLRGAAGRMQRVVSGPVLGIVDYAHTPEALELVLATARRLRPDGKLIVVGGCGGERDTEKRPAMGAAIASADVPIFTSDNPRSEQIEAIIEAMLNGVTYRRARVQVEPDRRSAIRLAGRLAGPGDLVLLVGKGHENAQETAGTKQPWNDANELRHALLKGSGMRTPSRSSVATEPDRV